MWLGVGNDLRLCSATVAIGLGQRIVAPDHLEATKSTALLWPFMASFWEVCIYSANAQPQIECKAGSLPSIGWTFTTREEMDKKLEIFTSQLSGWKLYFKRKTEKSQTIYSICREPKGDSGFLIAVDGCVRD